MNRLAPACWIVMTAALAACHHGSDSSPPPPTGAFTIGGTVTGLAGSGLVLRNNGSNDLAVTANGSFVFAGGLADGAAYAVTVRTQPSAPTQDCSVGNGSGTVAAANVTNITVTCTTRAFKIGGTVSGLTNAGLMLRDVVAGVTIPINSGSTAFQFPGSVPSGGTYFVAITSQPSGSPTQVCTLGNAAGVVGGADVASIDVLCNSGTAKFVYVTDSSSNTVNALQVDGGSGGLSLVQGSPFAASAAPKAMVATPSGAFLYVQSDGAGLLSGFAVNAATGALTPVPGSPFSATGGSASLPSLYLDPSGRFLYVQRSSSSLLYGYSINSTTGSLAAIQGSPFTVPTGTAWLGFDPLGRYAYSVAGGAAGTATAYQLNGATGALTAVGTPVSTFTQNPPTGAVHPNGSFVFAADGTRVHALRADLATGQLASAGVELMSGSRLRVDPLGRFLYLTGGNAIFGFTISSQNGALAPIPGLPIDSGVSTADFDIDPSGSYLYVPSSGNQGQGALAGFRIDATTGALTSVSGSPITFGANTNPSMARVDGSGRSLFVSSFGDDKIARYSIDPATGALVLASAPITLTDVGAQGFILVGTQ